MIGDQNQYQRDQENVSYMYTMPPQEQQSCDKRTWVDLTDEAVRKICVNEWGGYEQCRAVEAALKELNT